MLFPPVKKSEINGFFSLSEKPSYRVGAFCGFGEEYVCSVFGKKSAQGNITLNAVRRDEDFPCDEAYLIRITGDTTGLCADISAKCDKGLVRALYCIARMAIKNEFASGFIYDYPSFASRGYIEGFYGKPWKPDERLKMLEIMALFGENTHYYAPKDDPYHRNKWKELYPEEAFTQLKALVDRAKELCVDFHYCIAPGLSMRYSSQGDMEALFRKTEQLYSIGIKGFGLLLDDIPSDLFYEEDKRLFGNAAAAHVYLTEKYSQFLYELDPSIRLTVCPTCYHGKGDEKELVDFAGNVPENVSVFFTGTDICSKELTFRDADVFYKNTSHKPLYWDNYPVNDAEMFMEMHMGPLMGREGELYKCSEGMISNCMEYFDCNIIPLITAASYMWDPSSYDAEASYDEALLYCFPDKTEREDMRLFADHLRTSCLKDENSRIMGEYFSLVSVLFQTGDLTGALRKAEEYARLVRDSVSRLKKRQGNIYTQLERWLKKFYLMSEILDLSLEVLKGEDKREELENKMSMYNESATVLTAFCFREYIEFIIGYEN